ncbi:MAG TPA: hypothetical protein VIK55_06515 [Paludibacter sp.]
MTDNSNYPSGVNDSTFDERDVSYGGCIYTSDNSSETEEEENERLSKEQDYNDPEK